MSVSSSVAEEKRGNRVSFLDTELEGTVNGNSGTGTGRRAGEKSEEEEEELSKSEEDVDGSEENLLEQSTR